MTVDPVILNVFLGVASLAAGWAIRHFGGAAPLTPAPVTSPLSDLVSIIPPELIQLVANLLTQKKMQDAHSMLGELHDTMHVVPVGGAPPTQVVK